MRKFVICLALFLGALPAMRSHAEPMRRR